MSKSGDVSLIYNMLLFIWESTEPGMACERRLRRLEAGKGKFIGRSGKSFGEMLFTVKFVTRSCFC